VENGLKKIEDVYNKGSLVYVKGGYSAG